MLIPFDLLPDAVHAKQYLNWVGFKPGVSVASSHRRKVFETPGIELYKYESLVGETESIPVLIVPSLINRSYVLDMAPEKSFVEKLLKSGRTVYMLEWKTPRSENKYTEPEEHLIQYPSDCIDFVRESEGVHSVHLIGHCLGGVVTLLLAGRLGQVNPVNRIIESVTLLTSPVDFTEMGFLGLWAKEARFDIAKFQRAYGNMKWPMMQISFQLAKPLAIYHKLKKLYSLRDKPAFVNSFLSLELWSLDQSDFPEKVFQFFIDDLYRKNLLRNPGLHPLSIELKKITTPILNYFCTDDHIVPPQSVIKKEYLSETVLYTEIEAQGGHVGSVIGGTAQKVHWDKVLHFLKSAEKNKLIFAME